MTAKPTDAEIMQWLDVRIEQYGDDDDLAFIPAVKRHLASRAILHAKQRYWC